ncbi:MAG: hypothetical protein Q4D92_07950 [Slackia sp.]|nr:hypothetical protein [Slackia sp.]
MKIFGLDPVKLLVGSLFPAPFPIAALIVGVFLCSSAKKGDAARKTALAALVMGAASVPEAFFGFIGAIYGLILSLIACILARSCKRYADYTAVRFMAIGAFVLAIIGLALSVFMLAKTGLFAMFFGFDGWFGSPA